MHLKRRPADFPARVLNVNDVCALHWRVRVHVYVSLAFSSITHGDGLNTLRTLRWMLSD